MVKITVVDGGKERKIILRDDGHFRSWRAEEKVKSLKDIAGYEISHFDDLVEGDNYTLGPQQQQEQRPYGTYTWIEKHQQQAPTVDPEKESMRKRILALEMQDSRAVSYADYFNEKSAQGRIRQWLPPPVSIDSELPTPLRDHIPQGGEKEIVKPFWKRILEENKLVAAFSNGYEVGYLGPKIPDVAFYSCNVVRPTASEFLGFGDCKGNKWTGTSAAEKGQVMQYGHRILDAQPQRSHVHGFITNNARVVLIRAERANQQPFGIFWSISAVMSFEHGMKAFFRLLEHDHGFVTPPTVAGSPLVICRPLRPGGTCRAFAAIYQERDMVAKLYDDSNKAREDASKIERVRIAIIGASVSTELRAEIPNVVAVEGDWLLLSPLGTRFTVTTFKSQHLKMLLQVLRTVHQANIIHRDVRFANIFWLPNDAVLLNDWGASTNGGSRQLVQGCPQPFCHPELVDAIEAVPEPKHDLYSLVVSTAYLLLPGLSDRGHQRTLTKAFSAAEQVDYDGVWQGFVEAGI